MAFTNVYDGHCFFHSTAVDLSFLGVACNIAGASAEGLYGSRM
jgi:hypothetical protein